MQSKLFSLLHIQYRSHSLWNILKYEKDSSKKNKYIGVAFAYAVLAVIMAGYCFAISYGLGYLKMGDIIPGYALTITSLVTLFFTFFKTNGYLFACKDNDFLMSLPFSMRTIISSRFFYMYGSNLPLAMVVMLPMMIGYLYWTASGAGVIAMWILGILFAPLLPMTAAAIIGTIIIGIGSRFRFKVLVQVILSLALIFGIFFVSFSLPQMAQDGDAAFLMELGSLGQRLSEQIHSLYPVSTWFDTAICMGNFAPFLRFAGSSILCYGVFVLVTGYFYRGINTALMTSYSEKNYQMESLKTSSVMKALVKKEAKRFFSSSLYVMNMGMGLFMSLLAAVSCLIAGPDRILSLLEMPSLQKSMLPMVPFVFAMVLNMTCTTAVSLSLEGKHLWIMQSFPIETKTLLQSKILFNLLLLLPVSVVCDILLIIAFRVPPVQAVLYLLIAFVTALLSSFWGSFVNVHFPNYTWENEVEVVKQGAGSMFGILGAIIGFGLCTALVWALCLVMPGELAMLLVILAMAILAALLYKLTMKQAKLI